VRSGVADFQFDLAGGPPRASRRIVVHPFTDFIIGTPAAISLHQRFYRGIGLRIQAVFCAKRFQLRPQVLSVMYEIKKPTCTKAMSELTVTSILTTLGLVVPPAATRDQSTA